MLCSIVPFVSICLISTVLESQERMYYGFEESTSVGLVFVLVSVRCPPVPLQQCVQGLVLVYVTAILVIMARQFRRLDSIEEDLSRCLVVNSSGTTSVETVRSNIKPRHKTVTVKKEYYVV